MLLQEELDEVLRGRDRGARTDQSAEGRRKVHQSELTKKMNQEARVSRVESNIFYLLLLAWSKMYSVLQ